MRKNGAFYASTTLAAVGLVWLGSSNAAAPTDAVSGASRGQKMVTVSDIVVSANNAKVTFSEGYRNGSLRLYYSTTAFSGVADTTRATVTKMTVSTRGSGAVTISGLAASTKYYCKFQGWYGKGEANYWATFSFTTNPPASVRTDIDRPAGMPDGVVIDASGRIRGAATGVSIGKNGQKLERR